MSSLVRQIIISLLSWWRWFLQLVTVERLSNTTKEEEVGKELQSLTEPEPIDPKERGNILKLMKKKECLGSYCYLVRHGEREDHTASGWKGKFPADPPLSKKGKSQATDTGLYLLQEAPVKPCVILTSPFLRTLQTAECMAKSLEVPIVVEPLLSEFLAKKMFKTTPKLNSSAASKIVTNDTYVPLESKLPKWPEKEDDATIRFIKTVQEIVDKNPKAPIAIVTHRFGIETVINNYLSRLRSADARGVSYCSVTTLERRPPPRGGTQQTWKYHLISSIDHLTNRSSMYFKR